MLADASITAIIPVGDLGRARTFYEKMLGLKPQEVNEAEGQVVYAFSNAGLLVYQTGAARGEATKVGIVVDDLAQSMSDLKGHGVVFEDFDLPGLKTVDGVFETEQRKSAWFTDLDGNYISLMQRK